jgi:hypothetical protein
MSGYTTGSTGPWARRISRFIEDLLRPHVLPEDVSDVYALMAADAARETEAKEWAEALVPDVADEAW